MHAWYLHLDVSENSATPKSSHFNRVFHEINHPFWWYHYFWKYPHLCCKPLLLEGMTRLLLRWRIGDVRKNMQPFWALTFFFMLCRQQYKLRFSVLLNESPTNTETYSSLFQYHHQQQQKQNITCAIHYLTLFLHHLKKWHMLAIAMAIATAPVAEARVCPWQCSQDI